MIQHCCRSTHKNAAYRRRKTNPHGPINSPPAHFLRASVRENLFRCPCSNVPAPRPMQQGFKGSLRIPNLILNKRLIAKTGGVSSGVHAAERLRHWSPTTYNQGHR
ncbi:unnamed protein product [Amoebophrya sp. A120]|nr:unnamed protein product [Amoebophrya sp. A120]|eukprot:GSA120T00015400001.1